MLRISKKADYAVFLLGCIARQGAFPGGDAPGTVVSAQEIARQAGLNKSVVANLLKAFTRHGLLESVRGLHGGYRLLHTPQEISLAQVLEVVEGPFTLVDCIHQPSETHAVGTPRLPLATEATPCTLIGFCPTKTPMRLVHERIAGLFRQIKLDELCGLNGTRMPVTLAAHR